MTNNGGQRDVVFTPFMLRVRDAVSGTSTEPTKLQFEASGTCAIAAAIDEWVGMRTYAEHMIAEANAMLDPDAERITLEDESGTGELAFELGWRGRRFRLFVHRDPPAGTARIEMGDDFVAEPEKPADIPTLDDIIVDMLIQVGRGAR